MVELLQIGQRVVMRKAGGDRLHRLRVIARTVFPEEVTVILQDEEPQMRFQEHKTEHGTTWEPKRDEYRQYELIIQTGESK